MMKWWHQIRRTFPDLTHEQVVIKAMTAENDKLKAEIETLQISLRAIKEHVNFALAERGEMAKER